MIGNKLTVDVSELRTALNFTSKTTERRNTIPVLSLTLFQIENGKLSLTTTDLDQWATEVIECEAEGSWAFLAQSRVLLRLMSGLAGPASIEIVEIRGATGMRFEVDGTVYHETFLCGTEEFPEPPNKGARKVFEVGEGEVFAGLRHTMPCISTEETRYYLNGVYFERQEDGKARLISTDGHRLGLFDLDAKLKKAHLPFGGIIRRKSISSLINMVRKDGNRTLTIQFFGHKTGDPDTKYGEHAAVLTIGNRKLATKMIDGTYPDYRRVLPSEADKIDVTVNREAMRRVMALDGNAFNPVRVSASEAAITWRGADIMSEIRVPITANSKDGDDIGFNGRYLKQMVDVYGTLRIKGLSHHEPARLIPDDPRALYVLMPAHL